MTFGGHDRQWPAEASVHVQISPAMADELERLAAERGTTIAQEIEVAVAAHLLIEAWGRVRKAS